MFHKSARRDGCWISLWRRRWWARPSRWNSAMSSGWSPMQMSRNPGYAQEAVNPSFINSGSAC